MTVRWTWTTPRVFPTIRMARAIFDIQTSPAGAGARNQAGGVRWGSQRTFVAARVPAPTGRLAFAVDVDLQPEALHQQFRHALAQRVGIELVRFADRRPDTHVVVGR